MRIPARGTARMPLVTRATDRNRSTLIIVAIIVVGLLALSIVIHFTTKALRAKGRGGLTKSRTSGREGIWNRWPWRRGLNRANYSSTLQGDELSTPSHQRTSSGGHDTERDVAGSAETRESATTATATAGVDRNTSVRSIMTLPAYSPSARENERILGREGERAGIDVVVEFPETVHEEEERREEEMDSLYQIRVARRAEAAEREQRRQLRREARARGDLETLAQLRRRGDSGTSDTLSHQLIAEHQNANRERRVSSVQYAELGVARHDGSRVRANSSESDRRPLLDSAASMAESRATLTTDHRRDRSNSSVLSISTNASEEDLTTQRTLSRTSGNTDFEIVSLNHSRSPSASRSQLDGTPGSDMGTQSIPTIDPPVYDDLAMEEAPPYESPISPRAPHLLAHSSYERSSTSAPQLPSIERLPSIRVTNAPQEPQLPSTYSRNI